MSARWGEAIVGVLCAPPIAAGAIVLAALFRPAFATVPGQRVATETLAQILVMSPILVLAGAIAVTLASIASPWLPGRTHVKLALIGAGWVAWVIGFVLLLQPGLIDLP